MTQKYQRVPWTEEEEKRVLELAPVYSSRTKWKQIGEELDNLFHNGVYTREGRLVKKRWISLNWTREHQEEMVKMSRSGLSEEDFIVQCKARWPFLSKDSVMGKLRKAERTLLHAEKGKRSGESFDLGTSKRPRRACSETALVSLCAQLMEI